MQLCLYQRARTTSDGVRWYCKRTLNACVIGINPHMPMQACICTGTAQMAWTVAAKGNCVPRSC